MPPANYLIDTAIVFDPNLYNETMLRAAIWRCLLPREIGFLSDYDESIAKTMLEYVFNSNEQDKSSDR